MTENLNFLITNLSHLPALCKPQSFSHLSHRRSWHLPPAECLSCLLWGQPFGLTPELRSVCRLTHRAQLGTVPAPSSLTVIDSSRSQWLSQPIRRERATALVHSAGLRLGSGKLDSEDLLPNCRDFIKVKILQPLEPL